MPTTCEINFPNNPEKVFYGGQILDGTVLLKLTSEKTVRGIYVEIYGQAYAHWTETEYEERNGKRESVTKSYTGSEDYLCERKHFVGGPNGRVDVTPGTYNYNFQCVLPAQLPTSVSGEYGCIRYGARVVLDYPFWPDKVFHESFTVIKQINLNIEPGLREPVISENVKTFMPCGFLCCWESGPLRIIARTPVGGYTPGQTINLEVNVYNESDEKVTHVEARLVKQTSFYARLDGSGQEHHRQTSNYLAGEDGIGCNVNQNKRMIMNLRVPPTSPTDCSTSNIILVKYYIEVVANAEGCCSKNLEVSFPVTIGTYPIQDNIFTQPTPSQNLPEQIHPSAPLMPEDPKEFSKVPSYSDTPSAPTAPPQSDLTEDLRNNPPTYEEAIGGSENADGEFKPKYPIFKRQTSYSSGS